MACQCPADNSRTLRALIASLAGAAALACVTDAEAIELVFTATKPGGVVATGNTLGLSKQLDLNGPGTEDSIGTFITLGSGADDDPANPGNPWPSGTTNDWMLNGSTGVLTLPQHADVLHAELVWGGSYNYWPEDVTAFIDEPVLLATGSDLTIVDPDPLTALTVAEWTGTYWANYYVRSADVTQFVSLHGSGTYSVESVPATQTTAVDDLNAAGWTLVVAYRDEEAPYRNLAIFVGGSWVDENSQQDYGVSGFCAPPYGAVEGHVVVSAIEGDADRVGDTLSIAPAGSGPFVGLSGPNNPANNFFCSQINGPAGLVDTQGSFGAANHDALAGQNIAGGRQGWDVTTVDISSAQGHLSNGQSSAVIRTETTGDSYVPALVAFEIDVKSPDFTGSNTAASTTVVMLQDAFTVTARLSNQGEAMAANLQLQLPVDPGLSLTGFTLDGSPGDAQGNPVTAADLNGSVDVGELPVSTMLEAVLSFEVVGPPANGTHFTFAPAWSHSFQMCDNGEPIADTYSAPTAQVAYQDNSGGSGGMGGAGGAGGAVGTGGAGNTGNDGSNGNDGAWQDPGEEGSCGCEVPGGTGSRTGWPVLLGFALLGLLVRRRSPASRL